MAILSQKLSVQAPNLSPEWISWKIRKRSTVPSCILTIVLIISITVLLVLSNVNHGFAKAYHSTRTVVGVDWHVSTLWVFIPSLLFQIYGLYASTIIDAFGFRQPFIELQRGAIASKTIALDYASFFPVQREYKAFRNGHYHLGISFSIALLAKIVLGPLAARMFVEQSYTHPQPVQLNQDYSIFSNPQFGEFLGWDLATVAAATSSTKVYGGAYPRWMDGNQVFLNFTLPQLPPGNVSTPSVSADTVAYFAKLDCKQLGNVDDHLEKQRLASNPQHAGRFFLNGTDNDCDWKLNFEVTADFTTYLRTNSETDCGDYGESSFSGRLVLAGGTIESMDQYNLTVIVCVPTYWVRNGSLTQDMSANALNSIKNWTPYDNTTRELRPEWWSLFEQQIQQLQYVDTTTAGGSGISTTIVGRLVLDYSIKNFAEPFSADSLTKSAQEVYATLYATLLSTFMIRPSGQNNIIDGLLSTTTDRLFIANAFAGVILGLLVAIAGVLVLIVLYTRKPEHRSVLFEEPIGLLGYAGLLADSIVNRMVNRVRENEGYRGTAGEDVMAKLNAGQGTAAAVATLQMAEFGNPRKAHIVLNVHGAEDEEAFISLFDAQSAVVQRHSDEESTSRSGVGSSVEHSVADERQSLNNATGLETVEMRRLDRTHKARTA